MNPKNLSLKTKNLNLPTTRFAPSPTGHLHLGHIYAALFARNLARELDGNFLLRFEDIDTTRIREEFYTSIEQDLEWLGIHWHRTPIRQTDRLNAYNEALEKLKNLDVVYPCFCSRKDIERELGHITRAPHGPEGPLYPNTCRNLTDSQITHHLHNGEIPSWRINTEKAANLTGPLTFHDLSSGTTQVDPHLLGDTILARNDIGTSYHIAVTIDDAFQSITHVTRGTDLIHATHLHRVLQKILNLPEPTYHHHQLINDEQGNRLAKRHQSLSIKSLRENGYTPAQVLKKLP